MIPSSSLLSPFLITSGADGKGRKKRRKDEGLKEERESKTFVRSFSTRGGIKKQLGRRKRRKEGKGKPKFTVQRVEKEREKKEGGFLFPSALEHAPCSRQHCDAGTRVTAVRQM